MAHLVRLLRRINSEKLQSVRRTLPSLLNLPSKRDPPPVQPCHAPQTYLNPSVLRENASFKHLTSIFRPCLHKYDLVRNIQRLAPNVATSISCPVGRSYQKQVRYTSNTSVSLKVDNDVVRFCVDKPPSHKIATQTRGKKIQKNMRKSRKAKLNELKRYRLKAKKKMTSPNPEVRIRYKLEKAKRKEEWLIEKLRKFELPKPPAETYDPEILTEEEKFYLKRTGEKKKNYVPVGRRGVFGGVVLNMHLHWKRHETVKVICRPCKPGQVYEYAEELTRLSKGIVIDIKANNTIIFYRGKNYVQPKVMSPEDTLSKSKALEKYTYEQSLEHTSQFIEKLEKELEEYHKHIERYIKNKEAAKGSVDSI